MRDLGDQRRARAALQAQLTAEAASQAKTEFLSRMSHELRTPLNAVLGFAQLLQAGAGRQLDERGQMQLEQIRQAGWHLLALINDVLDVSRIETGAIHVEARMIELRSLLDEVIEMSGAQAQAHGVSLRLSEREALDGCRACGDPVRLRQVLLNLISNAIKYNRPGGQVRLGAGTSGARVTIRVEDNGLGMTRQQLEHLYEPFNRLGRERGGVEGSGIGLVLTRQLVMLMRGTIEVFSEPGQGTLVTLMLPADEAGSGMPCSPSSATAASSSTPAPALRDTRRPASRQPTGCVLYIEDNEVNHLVVEQLLARWPKVHLVRADDGASGLRLARSMMPSLVLLDMQLPDMDGTEVLQALRGDASTQALPVVALSASAMPQEIERARLAGAQDYWTKPLDFDHFLASMERLLPGSELTPGTGAAA
jgi:CheY-like chemotaxis protein/anti-sigma regulatory factor (Ser/Thr protein kinase)